MNQDVKTWINHINRSNKRKRDMIENDTIVDELICSSVENLIKIINESNIDKDVDSICIYLDSIRKTLINTKNLLFEDNMNENKNMKLLICASLSLTIDIIEMVKLEKRKLGRKLNIINFLNNYKKNHNVPVKNRKLETIDINMKDMTKDGYIKDDFLVDDSITPNDTTDDDDDDDEDYLPEIKGIDKNTPIGKFIDQLKQLSNGNNNSKDDMINYFNKLDKNEKDESMEQLKELNASCSDIPSLFRILYTPLTSITKKNLISKMLNVSNGLNENGKMKKWLDDVMKIPFGVYKGIDTNNMKLTKPKKINTFLNTLKDKMNSAVWGHDNAKKQIVEIMAQQIRNPQCKGNMIGLWGPPGNGKTTLIKHGIAMAMDKPFIFISLGGATDASFLEGHSFTYEGSIYGRIAQALIDAKCMNPIIYFDELDKVSSTPKGEEIINMLIHLTDPVQNQLFRDKYFYDVDLDLSKVTFIFSFNDMSMINYVLKDRITMIETKHLTLDQKQHIASNYLLPDILKDMGMESDSIVIPDDIITNIINNYTNEGGVRSLKKNLYRIVRELNVANLTNTQICNNTIVFPLTYTYELYANHYHGKSPYNSLTVHKMDGIGMVNGLWANSLGVGGVLPIETVLIPTDQVMSVKATGSLGNVIKESIDVAMSVAWNYLDTDTKNSWMKRWKTRPERFHVHCPDGSTEKEGPSAGAAMSLAFYSRLTNKKICHTIAMTGEINLRGEVTEIGGLEEKLCAAKRAGAKLVLIPQENSINLIEIKKRYPTLIDREFEIKCVNSFEEVIHHCLV